MSSLACNLQTKGKQESHSLAFSCIHINNFHINDIKVLYGAVCPRGDWKIKHYVMHIVYAHMVLSMQTMQLHVVAMANQWMIM